MPARGVWIRNSGKPQGCVRRVRGRWGVAFKTKSYKKWKVGFADHTSAEQYRRRKSDKHLLTRNRIRKKVGHPGVMEMMIHRKGRPWVGDLCTFDASDLPMILTHRGAWSFVNGYACTIVSGKTLKLCNFIRPPSRGMVNDHINRDRSDDRRANLRFATVKQNGRNKKKDTRNTSGENGISEKYRATFHSYDHAQQKWLQHGVSTSNTAGRDVRTEAETLRDRLGAKTKAGKIPKINRDASWQVDICAKNLEGGSKSFRFDPNDEVDRQRAFQEAVVYRDMLQARCNSTNGKTAQET